MSEGIIAAIYVAAEKGAGVSGHKSVAVRAGKGIVGDRYYSETGKNRSNYKGQPDWEITLVEAEAIEEFNANTGNQFHESDLRRNLVTRNVQLNDLVGKHFQINGTKFYGVQLCEPCASLQKRLGVRILPDLVGRGGLRAQILGNGNLTVGDALETS
jgi:MOSC domain-containing protein YiiM